MNNTVNRNLQNAYSDGSHFLIRLYYVSEANESMSSDELKRILEHAKSNNKKKGITGALIFNKNYFIQVIEGSRPIINDLLNALARDDRHFNVQVVSCEQVESRNWVDWDMNYFSHSAHNNREFMRYSPTPVFNPYMMSANAIKGVFEALSKNQYIQHSTTSTETSSEQKASVFSILSRRGEK